MKGDHTETAWLVEWPHSMGDGETRWLGFQGRHAPGNADASGYFVWHANANYGLRFARQDDAVQFVGAYRLVQDLLPHSMTTRGLRSGDPWPEITSHVWLDGRWRENIETKTCDKCNGAGWVPVTVIPAEDEG